jgi:hypothetical protein
MTKKARLLVLGSVLCMIASPAAFADLFGFSVSNPVTTFDGTTFTATDFADTMLHVYRNAPTTESALFVTVPSVSEWNTGGTLEDFVLSMAITPLTATSAKGSGSFTIKDIEGDTIAGNVSGVWNKDGDGGKFTGGLSDVTYTRKVDDTFDGHLGTSMSMVFSSPGPWGGYVTQITMSDAWLLTPTGEPNPLSSPILGGSIDARVVPVPAAMLLGLLGMGVAGVKLRKFA